MEAENVKVGIITKSFKLLIFDIVMDFPANCLIWIRDVHLVKGSSILRITVVEFLDVKRSSNEKYIKKRMFESLTS